MLLSNAKNINAKAFALFTKESKDNGELKLFTEKKYRMNFREVRFRTKGRVYCPNIYCLHG